ncbi:MAG: hypothetical protein ACRCUS_01840 [Anaerovoracaceae bacterium]
MICIIVQAYANSVVYYNNQLDKDILALEGEVERIRIEIDTANNVKIIEKKAMKNLGMVYPEGEHYISLAKNKEPGKEFGAALKKQAFN